MDETIANLPTEDWKFAQTLRSKMLVPDYSGAVGGSPGIAKLANLVMAWSEIRVMFDIRCIMCDGYGHTKKNCLTSKRLSAICRTNATARNRLTQAVSYMTITKANHISADALPRIGGVGAYLAGNKRARRRSLPSTSGDLTP